MDDDEHYMLRYAVGESHGLCSCFLALHRALDALQQRGRVISLPEESDISDALVLDLEQIGLCWGAHVWQWLSASLIYFAVVLHVCGHERTN